MFRLDFSQSHLIPSKQQSSKSRLRQSKQFLTNDSKIRQKQNDSKHINSANDSKHINSIKSHINKQRKNSRRQKQSKITNNSPYQMTRSKSKKLDSSNRKIQQSSSVLLPNINPNISSSSIIPYTNIPHNLSSNSNLHHMNHIHYKQLNQLHVQLLNIKNQYKQLKCSYNIVLKQKQQYIKKQQQFNEEQQKFKRTINMLQTQIDRIKKECFKILQSEKFKNKKLQETLQEKQLMIAYLRKQNQNLKKRTISQASSTNLNTSQVHQDLQKLFFIQNSAPIFSYESYARISANTSLINNTSVCQNNILIEQNDNKSNCNNLNNNINHNNNIDNISKINNNNKSKQKKSLSFYQPNINKRHKKSELEQDSLSFSRDRSKQFDSVHSLLSHNNDQTILSIHQYNNNNNNNNNNNQNHVITFTKKDHVYLNQSLSLGDDDSFDNNITNNNNNMNNNTNNNNENIQNLSQSQQQSQVNLNNTNNTDQTKINQQYSSQQQNNGQCLTFQNRIMKYDDFKIMKDSKQKQKTKQKYVTNKNQIFLLSKKSKTSNQHTKRLQIITDQFVSQKVKQNDDVFSIQYKKKTSKSRIKNNSHAQILKKSSSKKK